MRRFLMSKYKPPKNPNINDMSLKELTQFKEYLITKIENIHELIDDVEMQIGFKERRRKV
tara:strand:- start:3076 stop:3255 length:180 start_codon:yes stop_codon:yes gene_type:complete